MAGVTIDPRVQQYIDWQPLAGQLPRQHAEGFSLEHVEGYCKHCEKPTQNLRGEVTQWPRCIEVRFAGHCEACRLVTHFRLRWYGTHLLHRSDLGWILYPFTRSFWRVLRDFFT